MVNLVFNDIRVGIIGSRGIVPDSFIGFSNRPQVNGYRIKALGLRCGNDPLTVIVDCISMPSHLRRRRSA
jgi:hypothetical protein